MKRAALLALVVPGVMLHLTAHFFPELWPYNNQFVDWWHKTWWNR